MIVLECVEPLGNGYNLEISQVLLMQNLTRAKEIHLKMLSKLQIVDLKIATMVIAFCSG